MSAEQIKVEKGNSCSCPFCDEPICPDPQDGRYSCKNDGKLKIHRVDCVGLYCPVPVMRAKEEVDLLDKGNLMELMPTIRLRPKISRAGQKEPATAWSV